MAVGDTGTLVASAHTGPGTPSCILFTSSGQADRFEFDSSDETVASVDDLGFITAVGPGETVLTARTEGVISHEFQLTVSDP